jgi:transposase
VLRFRLMVKRGPCYGLKHQKEKRSMEHFGGLDVSVKETSIWIVDDTGRIVKEVKVASELEALLKVLGKPFFRTLSTLTPRVSALRADTANAF